MAYQTQMGQAAESFGIEDKMKEGFGQDYMDTVLTSAFKRIAQSGKRQNDQSGMQMINNGMQFSGANQIKRPGEIFASMAKQGMDEESNLWQQNEQYKAQMRSVHMDVLKHEDTMGLQRDQMEAQQADLFDIMGRVGSILAAV